MPKLKIKNRWVGENEPTYFIADIAANHDGCLARAKQLIRLAEEAGADAAKFQHFRAPKIVSELGFQTLGRHLSHQAKWRKSVYQVYQDASLSWEWTGELKACCDEVGIDFFSAPYDFEAVDMLDPFLSVYKIGSGDITWLEMLERIARKGKCVILSTGASDISDVQRAVRTILPVNPNLILLQCNTNYTGSLEKFKHIHLNVLKTFGVMFPDVVLGLSDHTPGHATVLGAVTLGARVVEKHLTDDTKRKGPDHPFSMTGSAWREMVDRTRELEMALGQANKRVAENEQETVVIQRRCLRAARDLKSETVLSREMIAVLRPAPIDAIFPSELTRVIGRTVRKEIEQGDFFKWTDLA